MIYCSVLKMSECHFYAMLFMRNLNITFLTEWVFDPGFLVCLVFCSFPAGY